MTTSLDCSFQLYPRGKTIDQWRKGDVQTSDGIKTLNAMIWESKLTNLSDSVINDWDFVLNIKQDCYINKCWNGGAEIHQFTSEGEKIQTLFLLMCNVEDIKLDYVYSAPDILIPLHAGDYVVYHPSDFVFEKPITEKYGTVTPGFIYYFESDSFNASDWVVHYSIKKDIFQGRVYTLFVVTFVLLCIILISLVVTEFSLVKSDRSLEQKDSLVKEALNVVSYFVDAKDPYTKGHSNRVATYAKKIAMRMNMSAEECSNIYYAALLHDCGKCYIPDSILKKQGQLTDDEYEIIKKHTKYGSLILSEFTTYPYFSQGALYHHERFDGTGYPSRLKGMEIPLVARIICLADAFDAMNSNRCYIEPLSKERIIKEIEKNKGSQFDPDIADIVLKMIKEDVF